MTDAEYERLRAAAGPPAEASRSFGSALEAAGYDALLVGETLVKSGDPAREIQRLRGMG